VVTRILPPLLRAKARPEGPGGNRALPHGLVLKGTFIIWLRAQSQPVPESRGLVVLSIK
jgi:hypothetical protein